jgi:hypothetical protein
MMVMVMMIMKIDTGAFKIRAVVVINALLRGFPSRSRSILEVMF